MKRNPNLVHLSSEHHDGLVIALRIKKALDHLQDYQVLIDYIHHLWPSLKHHFSQEEDNFLAYPTIQKQDKLIKRMLDEHLEFEYIITKINPDNPDLRNDLQAFSTLLKDHIRFEERLLFPYIEDQLTTQELAQVGTQLEQTHRPLDANWGPNFWD